MKLAGSAAAISAVFLQRSRKAVLEPVRYFARSDATAVTDTAVTPAAVRLSVYRHGTGKKTPRRTPAEPAIPAAVRSAGPNGCVPDQPWCPVRVLSHAGERLRLRR